MFTRLSPRWRITLGSLVAAAVLVLIGLAVVRVQVAAILTNSDTSLAQSDLASFEKDITANPTESVDDPGTGVLVHVRDPNGVVQVNTLPHDLMRLVDHEPARTAQYTTTDDEGRTFVVVGNALDTSAGTWSLWAARSTSASELALEGLDKVLLIGALVLLLALGAASWVIATIALRPVEAARAREKQMVSDAAHELRTPLAALKTQLELAHDDFGNAAALAAQVRSAETSVDRLSSLASNLLELSRLESGEGTRSTSTAASLATEFTGSIDRARMLALRKGVNVDFELAVSQDQARYRIDSLAFGRLSDNLLSNAITAVDNSGTILATLSQGADGRLALVVSDDGPGMPEEFLAVAFERFSRPDASRTSATGGSGLGLALVQALARDAGGDATARNTQPGLKVTVSFPKM